MMLIGIPSNDNQISVRNSIVISQWSLGICRFWSIDHVCEYLLATTLSGVDSLWSPQLNHIMHLQQYIVVAFAHYQVLIHCGHHN